MTFTLFSYQEEALAAEAAYRAEHPEENRLAIVLPTGTGKAYTLCARAVRYLDSFEGAGNRVLVLVHTDELVSQLEASARYVAEQWPIADIMGASVRVGVVKAERDETEADIVIASVQTLANPARRARLRDVGLVIVDECHHATADSYQAIMREFGCFRTYADEVGYMLGEGPEWPPPIPTPVLGFTATLERGDGQGLGAVWQNVVYTRDIGWAVRKGYLKQPIGYRLEIDPADPGHGDRGVVDRWTASADTLDAQLCDSIAPERIVEKWQELARDRQTIVFAPLVRSARVISNYFADAGASVGVVYGDQPEWQRRDIVRQFKAGDIDVLCNAMVLTEGFDHPNVSCVIVARPTKSRPLFIQMAGRGLRRVPGVPIEDQDCILITLTDTTTDICSTADLSDRPLDRTTDGPLTVMEDQWDIGQGIEEAARHWAGKVDATQFDPIVARSSKVWMTTRAGHWFLPISTDREYVFLLDDREGTSIYVLTRPAGKRAFSVNRLHAGLPDLEIAMRVAEEEATDRGGDVGALLADRTRPWRNQRPAPDSKMILKAHGLGLSDEVARIMNASSGGKAGKVSDLIRRVEASLSVDKAVAMINARKAKT